MFLTSNNKNILKVWEVLLTKISKLCSDNFYYKSLISHDSEKVWLNFPYHSLTGLKKSLVSRRLIFALPPKNVS